MKKSGKAKVSVRGRAKVYGKAKTKVKRSASRMGKTKARRNYDQQTGRLKGRAVDAQERLEKRAEELIAEGVPATTARAQALNEMRDNPKMDWRRG